MLADLIRESANDAEDRENKIQEHACAYLLDQEVKVLGELGSEACVFQNLSVSLVLGPSRGLAAGAFLQPEYVYMERKYRDDHDVKISSQFPETSFFGEIFTCDCARPSSN